MHASGAVEDHLIRLAEASTIVELPASGPVRAVELNRDEQALVVVERGAPPRTSAREPAGSSQALQQVKPSRD